MRSLTLAAFLLAGPAVFAQSPGTPPKSAGAGEPVMPAAPVLSERNQKALDQFLKLWEERMKGITSLEAKCALTEIVLADGGKEERRVSTGEAQLMKPNYAKLLLKDPEEPSNLKRVTHMVADGSYLWEYHHSRKVLRVLQLEKDTLGENTLLTFMFGMSAEQLKKRYHLSVDVDDPKKYNENYVHITILPKSRADLQEFAKAELVLWKNNKDAKYADLWMLPARLWFQRVEKDQTIWQFENMTTQRKLTAKQFEAPKPGEGWTREWMKQPTPDVVRPVSGGGVPKK